MSVHLFFVLNMYLYNVITIYNIICKSTVCVTSKPAVYYDKHNCCSLLSGQEQNVYQSVIKLAHLGSSQTAHYSGKLANSESAWCHSLSYVHGLWKVPPQWLDQLIIVCSLFVVKDRAEYDINGRPWHSSEHEHGLCSRRQISWTCFPVSCSSSHRSHVPSDDRALYGTSGSGLLVLAICSKHTACSSSRTLPYHCSAQANKTSALQDTMFTVAPGDQSHHGQLLAPWNALMMGQFLLCHSVLFHTIQYTIPHCHLIPAFEWLDGSNWFLSTFSRSWSLTILQEEHYQCYNRALSHCCSWINMLHESTSELIRFDVNTLWENWGSKSACGETLESWRLLEWKTAVSSCNVRVPVVVTAAHLEMTGWLPSGFLQIGWTDCFCFSPAAEQMACQPKVNLQLFQCACLAS